MKSSFLFLRTRTRAFNEEQGNSQQWLDSGLGRPDPVDVRLNQAFAKHSTAINPGQNFELREFPFQVSACSSCCRWPCCGTWRACSPSPPPPSSSMSSSCFTSLLHRGLYIFGVKSTSVKIVSDKQLSIGPPLKPVKNLPFVSWKLFSLWAQTIQRSRVGRYEP